jgi:hypothetical protein
MVHFKPKNVGEHEIRCAGEINEREDNRMEKKTVRMITECNAIGMRSKRTSNKINGQMRC